MQLIESFYTLKLFDYVVVIGWIGNVKRNNKKRSLQHIERIERIY